MKKNIIKVKKYQRPLIFLVVMLLMVLSFIVGKITNVDADEINYEYQSNNIEYDSTNNSLNATNVKDAIDELYGKVGQCPVGQFCYSSDEIRNISGGNFLRGYIYDESTCVTGNETECVKTTCYNNGSCSVGTIIDYFVNNATVVRFHVLHDDGETMTMQSQRNTIYNIAWWSGEDDPTKGPQTIMSALKIVTDSWTNVNPITITSETTSFQGVDSIDNLCTYSNGTSVCSGNKYDIGNIAGTYRARMITMQEVTDSDIGQCKVGGSDNQTNAKSCRMFMNNYLYQSNKSEYCINTMLCIEDDHSENDGKHNYGYWTMGGSLKTAWRIDLRGFVSFHNTSIIGNGARAVVVVNK